MSFCELLKDLRDEFGVTQKEVALACGITPTCICQLENGSRNPTGSTIKSLAKYFGCSADYLLELDQFASPTAPQLSAEDKKLITAYHELDRSLQSLLWDMIKTWQKNSAPSSEEAPKKKA